MVRHFTYWNASLDSLWKYFHLPLFDGFWDVSACDLNFDRGRELFSFYIQLKSERIFCWDWSNQKCQPFRATWDWKCQSFCPICPSWKFLHPISRTISENIVVRRHHSSTFYLISFGESLCAVFRSSCVYLKKYERLCKPNQTFLEPVCKNSLVLDFSSDDKKCFISFFWWDRKWLSGYYSQNSPPFVTAKHKTFVPLSVSQCGCSTTNHVCRA